MPDRRAATGVTVGAAVGARLFYGRGRAVRRVNFKIIESPVSPG